jgi:hypothetical protein
MGNRAVIRTVSGDQQQAGIDIYLHWNGGPESVQAFVDAAARLGCRGGDYGVARLVQIISNFFGGVHSIGVSPGGYFQNPGDNGIYLFDPYEWRFIEQQEVIEYQTKTIRRRLMDAEAIRMTEAYKRILKEAISSNKKHF